ncbi:MAG TPA: hypothetical protein VNV61_12900 [Steroidobacteraceae bacterium]|nr:hypothetical protein [Steroidobacteraceae bacterium]
MDSVARDQVSGCLEVDLFPGTEELRESPGGHPMREALVSLRSE